LTFFEVALFKTAADQPTEKTRDYPNPTRERRIFLTLRKTQKHNPSLTQRVGIVESVLRLSLV
jgi:hypothetical protein